MKKNPEKRRKHKKRRRHYSPIDNSSSKSSSSGPFSSEREDSDEDDHTKVERFYVVPRKDIDKYEIRVELKTYASNYSKNPETSSSQ